jgi:hypothetical protein
MSVLRSIRPLTRAEAVAAKPQRRHYLKTDPSLPALRRALQELDLASALEVGFSGIGAQSIIDHIIDHAPEWGIGQMFFKELPPGRLLIYLYSVDSSN